MSAVFQSPKDEKVGTREDRDPDATRAFARPAVESFEGRTRIMAFEFGGKKDQAKAAAFATFGQGGRTPGSAGSHKSPAALRTNLSMYAHAPSKEVALEEFELYALERMRVLKAIDDGLSRGKKPAEMELLITKEDKLLTRGSFHLEDEETRKDEVSHFALRLAYCRTEELRRWFLAQECALFRHRFRQLRGAQQAAFLQHNGLDYHPIDAKEFERVRADLHNTLNVMMRKDDANAALANGASGFYAVPFEEVSDLVRGRRVFMSGGKAYVPQVRSIQKFFTHRPVSTFDRVPFQLTGELFFWNDPQDQLASLVVGAFRSRLSKALVVASRRWAQHVAGEEKERLAPVVLSLSKRYLGRDYGKAGGANGEGGGDVVTLKDLNGAAAKSFPLCAKNLFNMVKKEHHLRHEGRRQLQLYLKGIGLSLEEAMLFWKTEFCKKIQAEKFEKEYAYAVRHAYGKGASAWITPRTRA